MKKSIVLALVAFVFTAPQALAQQVRTIPADYGNTFGGASFEVDNFGWPSSDGKGKLSKFSIGAGGGRYLINGVAASGRFHDSHNFRVDLLKLQQTPDISRFNIINVGTPLLHRYDAKDNDTDPDNKDHLEIMFVPYGKLRYRDGKGGGQTAAFHGIELNGSHDFNDATSMYGSMQMGWISSLNTGNKSETLVPGLNQDMRASLGLKRYMKTKTGQNKVFAKAEVIFDGQSYQTKNSTTGLTKSYNRSNVLLNGTIGITIR